MSTSAQSSTVTAADIEKAFNQLITDLKASTPPLQKAILPQPNQRDLYQCAIYLNSKLKEIAVPYYFCGGFACINVGMTARTTSDIDIAVPNGAQGFGRLLDILSRHPFIQDTTGTLPKDSYYFYVESSGKFVEVDAIIAGFMAFPAVDQARIVTSEQMQLSFLEPAGLLKLKLSGWANETRRKGPKRAGDMSDITSIRDLLAGDNVSMDLKGLSGDMAKGLKAWVEEFKDLQEWQKLDSKLKL